MVSIIAPAELHSLQNHHPSIAHATVAAWEIELHLNALTGLTDRSHQFRALPGSANPIPGIVGHHVRLTLPGRIPLRLVVETIWNPTEGTFAYTGSINEAREWLFTLTVDSDDVLGRFYFEDKVLILKNDSGTDRIVLHELNRRKLPQAAMHSPNLMDVHGGSSASSSFFESLESSQAPACSEYQPSSQNGNVRVLFLYTPEVKSGINPLINSIVAEFNHSTANSAVDLQNFISVAGVIEVNDNFDGKCRGTILIDEMTAGVGAFANLEQWMADTHADAAFLLLAEDPNATGTAGFPDYCFLGRIGGIAWVLRAGDMPAYALSTVTYALGDFTAIHELGHVFAGLHEGDPVTSGFAEAGVPDCARGYVGGSQEWMTMMGGYVECIFDVNQSDPSQQPSVRLPIWSNPGFWHDGEWAGNPDTSFMARALEMTMPVAAAWGSYPVPAPQSSSSVFVQSLNCYGYNIVSWDNVTSAEVYQLAMSGSSSFPTQNLVYFGAELTTLVEVPSGQTLWYRAGL